MQSQLFPFLSYGKDYLTGYKSLRLRIYTKKVPLIPAFWSVLARSIRSEEWQ